MRRVGGGENRIGVLGYRRMTGFFFDDRLKKTDRWVSRGKGASP
jgi:hypothetical protein